jgi:SAM-dependent methyltransferase
MEILFDRELLERRRARAARLEPKADFLLRVVADELAARLAVVERHFEQAVELHGATGLAGDACLATGRIGTLERVETADMVAGRPVLAAPLDDVPLAPASVNLIISPLALHLVNDLPGSLVRIRRALKPDGLFLAAIPGAGTLSELRESLLAADAEIHGGASPRVIPFGEIRAIGGLMQRAGFALPVVDLETYTVRYSSLFGLMADLRAMGMANPLTGRSRLPVGRGFFLRAAEIYQERFSDPDGRIRASFAIVYVSGWAPHESQQKPLKPGSAKMRLSDALKPGKLPDPG